VKGVSTYYDADGNIKGQWVKTAQDREDRVRDLLDACQVLLEPLDGKAKTPTVPPPGEDGRLCVYPIGDHHHGMYAWAAETGAFDHNLAKSEALLFGAMDRLVGLAPPAKHALIINLGDFFHADNSSNRTNRSGAPLDVDTRFARVMQTGVKLMARCIDRALEKHEEVTVICEIGNHDDHSALVLAMALDLFYSQEPRVTIDTSPQAFHWYRFGRTLIGVTHGDGVKMAELPGIMAADRKEDWGETDHRYWYTGHVHHDQLKEYRGCIVESFRTLAPSDAWHARAGYRSGRDMKVDIIDREFGRIARHTVGVEQFYGEH
jgi:hypothetical protein